MLPPYRHLQLDHAYNTLPTIIIRHVAFGYAYCFLSFGLFNNRIDNLLSGEEVPHAASVELISKRVEERVEDGIRLCNNGKHLRAETCVSIVGQVLDSFFLC